MWEVQPAGTVKPPGVSHQGKKGQLCPSGPPAGNGQGLGFPEGGPVLCPVSGPGREEPCLFCAMDGVSVGGGGVVLTLV